MADAAPGLLVLFVFVNGLTGATALIETRQLGVSRRMMATPTPMGTIVSGEAVGRWIIAMIQAVYILVATMALFGMDWGNLLGAAAVLVAVSAVAAGAAMLFGASFSTPQQAGGVGVVVALGIDAFAELVRHDGTLVDILPQLGVLAAMATSLIALATWRLRTALTHGD